MPCSTPAGAGCPARPRRHHADVVQTGSAALRTQGRLIDHLRNTQSFGLEDLQALVLDEADRLLAMGFSEEVRGHMRPPCVLCMRPHGTWFVSPLKRFRLR